MNKKIGSIRDEAHFHFDPHAPEHEGRDYVKCPICVHRKHDGRVCVAPIAQRPCNCDGKTVWLSVRVKDTEEGNKVAEALRSNGYALYEYNAHDLLVTPVDENGTFLYYKMLTVWTDNPSHIATRESVLRWIGRAKDLSRLVVSGSP